MPNLINRGTFEGANVETKLLLIYDMLTEVNSLLGDHVKKQDETCERRSKDCDVRFKKIEGRRKVDGAMAAGGGVIGGFIAIVLKSKIWD